MIINYEKNLNNVLLVSHEMSYTGAPNSLLNLAKFFISKGKTVTVWTLKKGEFVKEFNNIGIEVSFVQNSNIEPSILKGYGLIILNTFFCSSLVKICQSYTRTILFIREAENIPYLAESCSLDTDNIKYANELICVSEYAENFIKYNYNPRKISILHNYVDDYYNGHLNIIKDNRVHYLLSGTYEERKGHDIVVEAFVKMPQELKKKTVLHLVGQNPEWSRLFRDRVRTIYDNRIIEHGLIKNKKDLFSLYKSMNVFIIGSRDEACSLVALEGAMLGKALIMSENVGAKYLDSKREYVYPTKSVDVLCRKMCELTSRRELLIQGVKMRRAYNKTSTLKIFNNNLLKILEE